MCYHKLYGDNIMILNCMINIINNKLIQLFNQHLKCQINEFILQLLLSVLQKVFFKKLQLLKVLLSKSQLKNKEKSKYKMSRLILLLLILKKMVIQLFRY
ncbi:unnamed protein product [Paramecium sonneborni]|uniref:Uncharacterized protein n=1 Tax=Paramecium sonneborni TaxID=65129 RepID=A0A8S1QB69_9CILI|nr:unnamed protein product [Paramecium sonneborni]